MRMVLNPTAAKKALSAVRALLGVTYAALKSLRESRHSHRPRRGADDRPIVRRAVHRAVVAV